MNVPERQVRVYVMRIFFFKPHQLTSRNAIMICGYTVGQRATGSLRWSTKCGCLIRVCVDNVVWVTIAL